MRFSIITCTFNSQRYLEDCLASVKNQDYKDFEVLIIDAYSTDNTLNIVKRYIEDIPIRVFRQKRGGIAKAMNYGIRLAQGDYLIHLHSDDMLFDRRVLRDVDNFVDKNNYPDWIYGKIKMIESDGSSYAIFPERFIFQIGWGYLLKYINFIPHQSVFMKKKVFESYGFFDERQSSGMDTDLWIRIYNKTDWKFFNRIISKYRIHKDAQSSSIARRFINRQNHENVQRRYTNLIEFALIKVVNRILWKLNKNQR